MVQTWAYFQYMCTLLYTFAYLVTYSFTLYFDTLGIKIQNSAGWRLGQKFVDFEQKHGNPTMDLLQWKFQIDFRTKVLNQYISENDSLVHFRPF